MVYLRLSSHHLSVVLNQHHGREDCNLYEIRQLITGL